MPLSSDGSVSRRRTRNQTKSLKNKRTHRDLVDSRSELRLTKYLIDQVLAETPQPFFTDPIMPPGREERAAWLLKVYGHGDFLICGETR